MIKKGYNAVLIEGDEQRYVELVNTTKEYSSIIPIKKYVDLVNNTLDSILETTKIPVDFTLLSIDVDSNDYHIWNSLNKYRPIIVVIEINSEINPLNFQWIHDIKNNMVGTSFGSMYELANNKGYEFLCHTGNMIFIRNDYFPKLEIEKEDNLLSNFVFKWILSNPKEYNEFLSTQNKYINSYT